ncbi:hypothetical protein GOP47_0001860 [Adiantum capillus-veneris]|uniref:Uncharacterized protein n=1 Tax=Adiantum capillus-veneris TaxID=13818 RepID=A0A9D4ZQJ0_ADICA|nr:hypothetical protein GOP47_0001860 [Adiantum capillus-veneris]
MEHSMLPLNYFCRNARLCMKKAAFSKKAQLFTDELLHLKKFNALVVTTIPSHPLYDEKKTEKQIVELQTLVPDIKRRMQQLEAELSASKLKDSNGVLKARKVHPKPVALPKFSCDAAALGLQQQKPVKKVKNVISKKLRKQQNKEARTLPNMYEADQAASPSASSCASPLKEHAFDSLQENGFRRVPSSDSREFHEDELMHCMVRESDTKSTVLPVNNGSMSFSMSRNPPCFAPSEATAALQCQQENGRWYSPEKMDGSSKENMPTSYLHRDFHNGTMPSSDDGALAAEKDGNGFPLRPKDVSSVSQMKGGNRGVDGTRESSREGMTGFAKPWWNGNIQHSHLSRDHGTVKAESMHKEWDCSRKSTSKEWDVVALTSQADHHGHNGGCLAHGELEKSVLDHGVSGHPSAKIAKEKDGVVMSIKSKLEEEYEKLRDQMRWFKYKEGVVGKEDSEKNQRKYAPFHQKYAGERKFWDGGVDAAYKGLNINSSTSYNGPTNVLGAENRWMSQEHVKSSHATDRMPRDKTDNLHSAANTSPPSPSAHHASLPFSHYISKLKQLVPNDASADNSRGCWPTQAVNCHIHTARTNADSPFHGVLKGVAPIGDQPENACAHSPSSSNTFADSLTYSNPVFELDRELDLPECDTMSSQLDRGLPKERIIPEGHLEDADAKNSHWCPPFSSQTEKPLEPSSTLSKHTERELTSKSLDCAIQLPLSEVCENEDFHSPLKDNETEDFTIAGHKFRFAKDFFLKKMQHRFEQVKNIREDDESAKDATHMQETCTGRVSNGWTNAQDWVEKQAHFIHELSCFSSNEGAATQDEDMLKSSILSSIPPKKCKETADVPWQAASAQSCGNEAPEEASMKNESHPYQFLQERRGSNGPFHDDVPMNFLDTSGQRKVDLRDNRHQGELGLQAKIDQLEKDLKEHKDGSTRESDFMKNYIDKDVRLKLDELVNTLEWTQKLLVEKEHEKEKFAYGLHVKVEDCEGKVKLIQEQVDCLIEEIKSSLIKEMMGNTCFNMQAMKDGCKGQLEVLEKETEKNLETLRSELMSSIDSMQIKTEARVKLSCDALEGSILQKLDALHSCADRDAMANLRNELCLIWEEIRQLSQGRDEIREQVGKLTKVAGETKESLNKEQSVILTESEVLKKQVQSLKRKNIKARNESKEIRRDVQEVVESVQTAFAQIREDSAREAESLKRLEESLLSDKLCMESLYERVRQTEGTMKEDVAMVKAIREELLREKTNASVAEKEHVMERMDQLSHYYLGALEEVREDLLAVKMIGQDRLQDMEYRWEEFLRRQHQSTLGRGNSLQDLVMDGLESRISHLEHILDSSQDLQRAQFKVDSILAITEKDQECASAAAAKAVASAHKAEATALILGSFGAEIDNARNNSLKLQETLQLEREAAAMACNEIRALSDDLLQEKNLAIAASSEAKRRSFEIWEGLQNDMMSLRNSLCLIDKDKEVASAAANEAMAAANKAEEVLEGLTKAYEEVAVLNAGREEVGEALQAMKEMHVLQEQEKKCCEMVEMRERVEDMVTALSRVAQSTSQLDEEHRKQEICLLDLSKQIVAATAEQKGILERVSDVSKKVQVLDHSLSSLSQTVDKVHTSTQVLEKATTKHEATEGAAVAELEKRICHLENPFQRDNLSENTNEPLAKQQIGAMEKQSLLSLYKEMSAFFKKLQKIEGQEEEVSEADKQIQAALATLETRVVHLENRLHQVEAGTSLATRSLDSRMEVFSSQLQTAIEAAMTAEGKCSALGSELVKVFRALASSKKESPPKLLDSEESSEQHKHPKTETFAVSKHKVAQNPVAACTSCKKGINKGSSVTTESSQRECSELDTKGLDSSDSHGKTPESMHTEGQQVGQSKARESDATCTSVENMHSNSSLSHPSSISSGHTSALCAHGNASSIEAYKGSASAARMIIHGNDGAIIKMGRKFSLTAHSHNQDQSGDVSVALDKDSTRDKSLDIVRREDSGVMILEGKLPITHAKLGKRRIECTKKESIHLSSTARDYQMTDIRLNAGRIFVNLTNIDSCLSIGGDVLVALKVFR